MKKKNKKSEIFCAPLRHTRKRDSITALLKKKRVAVLFCAFLVGSLLLPAVKTFALINYSATITGTSTLNFIYTPYTPTTTSACISLNITNDFLTCQTYPIGWSIAGIGASTAFGVPPNHVFNLGNVEIVATTTRQYYFVAHQFASSTNPYWYIALYRDVSTGWSVLNFGEGENSNVIITPAYPTDCFFSTTTAPISFNATGTIAIADSDPNTWFRFSVIANEFTTASTTYFSTTTALVGGDSYNYSIPVALDEGAWKISYLLQGVNNTEPAVASHYCVGTGIGIGLPLPTWKEITETEFLGLEDCSTYPLLERLVCDLKNAIKKIFVPSAGSMASLKTTIDGFSGKAPMNYINATKTFFSDIQSGLDNTQNVPFKVLGKSGNVDFTLFSKTATVAGATRSYADILKLFFTFVLVLGFTFWSIGYIRKVFR